MSEEHEIDPPKRPAPPRQGSAKPPAPPPSGLLRRDESPLMDYLRNRMELMERELHQSKERANASENALKQQEALRGEVEAQLKSISNQIQQEKTVQRLEEDKSASRGRVDSLEKRLDEMHRTWSDLLREAIGKREADVSLTSTESRAINEGLAELRQEMARFKEELAGLPKMLPDIRLLKDMIPADVERRAAEDKAVRENLRTLVDRMGENLLDRLTELDRRLISDHEISQERAAAMARERETLREAMEELRHNVRQESLKERISLESQFNDKFQEMKTSLQNVCEEQSGTQGALNAIKEITDKLHAILTQPAKAKDQLILDLEAEKRDLMDALNDRTERLRAYTLERREVERSLGESLMDLNRQLESERTKERQRLEHIASLENTIAGLQASSRLEGEKLKASEDRFERLAEERDKFIEALTLEAEKVQKQIAARTESEKNWERKIVEFQTQLNNEKEARLQAEQTISDLRAQIQTISQHTARVIREKENTDQEFAQWAREREKLQAQMRKKDEMIGMLSSTFKNIIRKPED